MAKKLLQMVLFIIAAMAIIVILESPMILFNGEDVADARKIFANQNISSKRLFISAWRHIKALHYDKTLNNQDWNQWKYKYLSKIQTDEDATVAINTILASLDDPYSQFFDTKHYELQESYIRDNEDSEPNFIAKMQKTYPSAKIALDTIGGFVKSAKVIEESTFFKSLKKGDEVIKINNYKLRGIEINSAINLIRSSNTYLSKVEIKRNNKIFTYNLPRRSMDVNKLSSNMADKDILKITIYTFMGKFMPGDFETTITQNPNVKGYIIDLRGDIGGQAINGLFIAEKLLGQNKKMLSIRNRNGATIPIFSQKASIIDAKKPIVILVDEKTASASEIFAGILQNNKRAILIGEKTYGKNAMQQIIPLPNKTCINLTTSYFSFDNNFECKNKKLTPEYEIKLQPVNIVREHDTQLQKAISIIKEEIRKEYRISD